jgi:hypothetical protein
VNRAAPEPPNTLEEYRRRLDRSAARARREDARALLYNRLIAATLALWIGIGWASSSGLRPPKGWWLLPAVVTLALMMARGRALARRRRAGDVVTYNEEGIARVEERIYPMARTAGERFVDDGHPYATDLDLFGEGSVFSLLSTARTPIGQETLAAWLKAPASIEVIRQRQRAVQELAGNLDLRESLAAHAAIAEREVKSRSLLDWAAEPVRAPAPALRVAAFVAGVAATASLLLLGIDRVGLPVSVAVVACLGAWSVWRRAHRATAGVSDGLYRRALELKVISGLLACLEQARVSAPALIALRNALSAEGMLASRQIARLARLAGWYESGRNQFYAILSAPTLLGAQFAMALQRWRADLGPEVVRWLRALGEVEALCSLATFSYEHPSYPFPELVEGDEAGGPIVEGHGVGHPLIPSAHRVPNDVHLGRDLRLILVSGSNMSGKSTYLRTVGVNVVLALAGAAVCARRLRLTPVALGATLRVSDSLKAGHSRFYAEIARLKNIVDLAHASPCTLALLDEILHGTNSHDRFLGAKAVVDALVKAGALTIVTTHDLALARLPESIGKLAANVHFQDTIVDGKLVFDYRMHPGVVTRSNALDLMRLVGLDV